MTQSSHSGMVINSCEDSHLTILETNITRGNIGNILVSLLIVILIDQAVKMLVHKRNGFRYCRSN